jgi:hypothetical protein
MKMFFIHAPEGTQVITQTSPSAFHGVAMDFAHPIAIIVTGPFPLAGLVTNLLENASVLWQVVIGLPLIGVHGTATWGMGFHKRLKCLTVAVVAHLQTNLTTFSTHHSGYRGAIVLPGAVPSDLVGPSPGGIVGITMFSTFFARILIHFIRFGDDVRQG